MTNKPPTITTSVNEWMRARRDLEEALQQLRFAQSHNASPDRISEIQRRIEYFTWRIRVLQPKQGGVDG